MAHHLVHGASTPEAWAAMVKNLQDRIEAVRPTAEKLGGQVREGYLAFGEYDLVAICEFPDNAAAAFSLAASAGGACKALETTPLLTTAEAMGTAAGAGYAPPG
jgi:uncharacterized protein with GYD domain